MRRMGHDFIILMHVSTKPESKSKLVAALNENQELKPLNVRVSGLMSRRETLQRSRQYGIRVHCVGEDRPGMLASIAQHLSDRNISVENLTTELRLSRDGKRDFVINAECVGKERLDKEQLDLMTSELSKLKTELGLDILDIRIHH